MRHARLLALIAVLGLAGRARAATPPPPDKVPRVALVVSLRVNVEPDEADLLADRLGDALQEKLLVDVIGGGEVSRRLADMAVAEDCVNQKPCVQKIAERLDADELVFLVVVRVGGAIQIDPTWTDGRGEKLAAREAITLEETDKLPERKFREAASRILPHLRERKPEQPVVVGIPGEGAPEPAPAPPPMRHMTRGTWIAGGVAAGALVGAVVFAGLAYSADADLEDQGCETTQCDASDIDAVDTKALVADSLFGVALVSAGVAGYLYYTSADEPPPVSVGAAPGGGVFVQAMGRF